MAEPEPKDDAKPPVELTRFQQLARALFQVSKRDVPKHEAKKRTTNQDNPGATASSARKITRNG